MMGATSTDLRDLGENIKDRTPRDFDPQEVEEVLKPDLPEALSSTHIDSYYKGFHVGFTIRSEDNKSIPAARAKATIEELIKLEFMPSWNAATNDGWIKPISDPIMEATANHPTSPITAATVPPTAPQCGIHGTPMVLRKGKWGDFWSCPAKNADGSFRNYRPVPAKETK